MRCVHERMGVCTHRHVYNIHTAEAGVGLLTPSKRFGRTPT